jgi:hypothetical protein
VVSIDKTGTKWLGNKGNNKIIEQSYNGKVKTHKYYKQTKSVNRETVKTVMTLTWYRHF